MLPEPGVRPPRVHVVAIIDLGRHLPYGVFTAACTDATAYHVGKRVYSVTDFA